MLCKRRSDQCCANHHAAKPAMATLLSQIRPTSMMLMNPSVASAALMVESKSHTLPAAAPSTSRFLHHHHHFSSASAAALENGHGGHSGPNNEEATLAQNFIYPLNGHHRAMSAPRLLQANNTERDLREKYWGKIHGFWNSIFQIQLFFFQGKYWNVRCLMPPLIILTPDI